MKNQVKFLGMLLFAASLIVLQSCVHDPVKPTPTGYKVSGQIVNADEIEVPIDAVKAFLSAGMSDFPQEGASAIATGTYKNGAFEIYLPESVQGNLIPFSATGVPDGLTVTDLNAKVGNAQFFTFSDTEPLGMLYCMYGMETPTSDISAQIMTIYVDRDVAITGTINEYGTIATYSMNLKKGWNEVYAVIIETDTSVIVEATTVKPQFNFMWYLNDYYGGFYKPAKAPKHHSFLFKK